MSKLYKHKDKDRNINVGRDSVEDRKKKVHT